MTANPLQSPQAGGGLLPCPFCQTGKPHVVNPASGAPPYVLCECGGAGAQRSTEAECIAAWNRRASTSGLAGEAVAKPLEWASEPPYSVARVSKLSLFYSTECVWDEGKFLYCILSGNCINQQFATLAEAKAAAQADFETRIRSALAVPPSIPAGGVGEALCATEGCGKPSSVHFIRGEVGSHFCADCYSRVARLETDRLASLSLPAGGVAVSDAELLDAMAKNIRLELSWGEVSDFEGEPCQWRVHERAGNRNDREWHIRGVGDTPRAALVAAIEGSR